MVKNDRHISCHMDVPASRTEVWNAWTTSEGAMGFFASAASIEARPDGAYELYFDPSAPEGSQGSEGMRILALQPESFLSFTWNAPPHLPTVRGQRTHVEIRLQELGGSMTRVHLRHGGWGAGEEWDQAFAYFERAWEKIVLPRLKYRFAHGPVDWSNPPKL